MIFCCTVVTSTKYAKKLDAIISGKCENVSERISIAYDNIISIDIDVYNKNSQGFAKGTLFVNGTPVTSSCNNEEVFGEWDFKYNEDEYLLLILEGGRGVATADYYITDKERYNDTEEKKDKIPLAF